MRLLQAHDDEDWAKMTADYNSSEDEATCGDQSQQEKPSELAENYSWFNIKDPDTYFCLATKHKNIIEAGHQVFHCYGRRTNRYLLQGYGFCLENNKYNSLSFRVWLDFNDKSKVKPPKTPGDEEYDEDEDPENANKICKTIRLKKHRLREDVFAYLRTSLMQKEDHKGKVHLLISSPVDPEFELLTVACAVNLL